MATFCEYALTQLKVRPGDRSLMVLPVHHIFGVCATYFMLSECVALGVCPDFRRLYDTVARFRVNCICLVPALAEILAEKIARRASSAEEAFGSPIDWVLIGGAPLSRRVYENLSALGIQPLTAYGLTETTALYSIATAGEDPHIGSAGRACDLPGVEVKVSDDGVLLVKGPNVMKGYYRDPATTEQVLTPDGWFRTGDHGRIDDDGYVWITGRASRTIVLSSGKKIAPEELEERIHSLPGVREVLVSGDGATREVTAEIYAVIPEDSVRRSIAALNNSLPVHKRIRTIIIRTEPFPRTDSGKIRIQKPGHPPFTVTDDTISTINRRLRSAKRTVKRAFTFPVIIMLSLAMLAVAVSVLGVVPDLLRHEGVKIPSSLCSVFRLIDLAGEFLLGFFALFIVFKIWDKRK
jgi:long-chain acyl-CoA synthetase